MTESAQGPTLSIGRTKFPAFIGCLLAAFGICLAVYFFRSSAPDVPDEDTLDLFSFPGDEQRIGDLAKVIEKNPSDWKNYSELALLQYNQGRFDRAVSAAKEALNINPEDANTAGTLALALVRLHRPKAALAELNKALELAPYNGEIYPYRALVWKELGYPDKMLEDYKLMLQWGGHLDLYRQAVEDDRKLRHPVLYWAMHPDVKGFVSLALFCTGMLLILNAKRRLGQKSPYGARQPGPLIKSGRGDIAVFDRVSANQLWNYAKGKYEELRVIFERSRSLWGQDRDEAERLFEIAVPGYMEFLECPRSAWWFLLPGVRGDGGYNDRGYTVHSGLHYKAGNWNIRLMVEFQWETEEGQTPVCLLYEFSAAFFGNSCELRCADARRNFGFGKKITKDDFASFYEPQ